MEINDLEKRWFCVVSSKPGYWERFHRSLKAIPRENTNGTYYINVTPVERAQ